jgi:hypothetical protein
VLVEQHDEWLTLSTRYLPQASMTRLLGDVPMTTLGDLLKGVSPSDRGSGWKPIYTT